VVSRLERRRACDLYHSAFIVHVPEGRFVIEQAPVGRGDALDRGVVSEGAAGSRWAERFRIFRYEIRCWRDGVLVVNQASRPRLAQLARVPGIRGAYGAIGRHPDYEQTTGVLVVRLESPLWYANASLALDSAGIELALADVRLPVIERARRSGLLTKLGEEHIFHTIDEAVEARSAGALRPGGNLS
jgi:hypothetical protein